MSELFIFQQMAEKEFPEIFQFLKKEKLKELLHNRKLVYAAGAGLLVFVLLAWLIVHFTCSSGGKLSPLNFVPPDAAMILEIRQPKELWIDLSVNSGVWRNMVNMEPFTKINREICFLDSLFNTNDCATEIISGHPVYISFHSLAAGATGFLYMVSFSGSCSKTAVKDLVKQVASVKATIAGRNFMGADIMEVSLPGKKEKFDYTFLKDVFICSFQPALVEAAVKQQRSGVPITQDAGFAKVAGTAGKKVNANLYINFKYFPSFVSHLASTEYAKKISCLAGFANWSALDVNVKKDAILFNGFSNAGDASADFLSLFANQESHEMEMLNIIPSSTASFVYFGFSDFDSWYKSYLQYLKKNGKSDERNIKIARLNSQYKTDVEKNITSWIGKEMALVITEPSDSGIASNMFAVIKTDNIDNAMTLLAARSVVQIKKADKPEKETKNKKVEKKKAKETCLPARQEVKKKEKQQKAIPPEIKDNKIYEYKIHGVLPVLFGKLFEGVEGTYYAVVDDYVIFANSSKALESFLKDYNNEKTLRNNNNYIAFSKNISSESNIYLYCNIKKSIGLFAKYANLEVVTYIGNNLSLFKNFEAFAYQLKTSGKLFYNNICLKSNTAVVEESNALWAFNLDSTVFFKPQLVTDNDTKTKKIIAFDNASNMYLIDIDGSLLWKVQLKEKPISKVFIVDYFNNKKNGYMFNTKSYIYLIDRAGKNIEDFPVKLGDASTAPMTVVYYANDKNYRLIVPCGNKIYNYLKNGSVNKGWTKVKTKSEIYKEITHLEFNGTDYLAVSDKDGYVYVTDRKGVEKIKIKTPFTASSYSAFYSVKSGKTSKQSILTTDNTGNLVFISSSGEVEKKTIARFSALHYFMYEDFNNDHSKEYIFLDNNKLSVFNTDMKPICSYTFPSEISTAPEFIKDAGSNGFIGVVSVKAKKIYLLGQNCSLKDGFPLNGATPFVIESLNNDGSLNLLVGLERTVYNYSYE